MLIKINNVGQYGVVRDAFAPELPANAWSNGRNMRFRNGYAERMLGETDVYDPPTVTPYHIQPLTTGTDRYAIYCGLNKIYAANGLTHTNITRQSAGVDVNYNATADTRWNGGVLSGIAILNNGVDDPQYWGGNVANKAAALTAWPASTKCKVIRPFRQYLVALNITKGASSYPYMVKWSHPADPGSLPASWDQTDATKDAGEFDLSEDPGFIVDGLALGETFIVYKSNAYYAMQWVGGSYVFRFQKISDYDGALSTNCVAYYPGGHLVFGSNDVFTHSGGAPQSILTGVMREWLYANLDSAYYGRSFVASNLGKNEIWICFPESGQTSCNLAVVWNWKDNTTTIRDLPNATASASAVLDYIAPATWDSDAGTWDSDTSYWNQNENTTSAERLFLASANTKIYLEDSGATFGGTAFSQILERDGLHMDAPEQVKLLKSIRPRIDAVPGTVINVYMGGALDQSSGTTWNGPYPFTVGTDYKVSGMASGRYLGVRFESTTTARWRIKSFDVEFDLLGEY